MADPDPVHYATPIRGLLEGVPFPTDFITGEGGLLDPVLDGLYYTDFSPVVGADSFGGLIDLVVLDEIALQLPGLDGVKIVLGGDASGFTRISASFHVSPRGLLTSLSNVTAALRFPREILKPVTETGASAPGFAQIEVRGSFWLDESFDLHVEGFDALHLRPSMIGDSGIIIEADGVKLDLSRTSSLPEVLEAGFDDSFLGVYIGKARVQLPEGLPKLAPEDLILDACAIGSGGVSGRLIAAYDDPSFDPVSQTYQGRGAGDFFGVPFAVKRAAIEVKQNALLESAIEGQILLPFFDKRVNVAIRMNLDGGFSAAITGAADLGDAYDDATGLLTLEKSGVVKVVVQSLRFEVLDGVLWTKLSGEITPLVGDVEWPTLQVTELSVDSKGEVAVDGGWLNLPSHPSFSFHGFQMEVTKFGIGSSDNGGRWVGLSGGVRLVDEITAGASVEGLRLTWYPNGDTRVSFEGVGVEFAVPKVLTFSGKVAFKEATPPATGGRFEGAIQVQLLALNLEISGSLIFGRHSDGTYLALYLSTELPAGIPLWSTGLALYGFAGLFGKDVEPDRLPDEGWYDGWYKRPAEGVTDLLTKWRPAPRSLALGAGATIGTLADNGYAFGARVLFAIVFPGPIILIEGRANLFKERAALSGAEPLFRALAVIDMREDTLTLGLDARYKYDEDGKLIDISGGAEAFFDRRNADAWHVYLGEDEPRTKRLRAQVFQLFTAESYFMLDSRAFRTGLWAGVDEKWKFGPFKLEVAAWVEAGASVSAKPRQYSGKLWFHGSVGVSIWRFGVDLEVDTHLEAEVFTPYHVLGTLKVRINLPWPLSDINKSVDLEWGPEPTLPPLALPLQSVSIEHFKVTTSWPLARGALLLPNYGLDGIRTDPDVSPGQIAIAGPPPGAPVVPLDCRPRLTFGRSVNDDALVAINPSPLQPEFEQIGNPDEGEGPMRVRFGLREVALDAWEGASWRRVARKVGPGHPSPNPVGLPELFGSWAPIAQQPSGSEPGLVPANSKLWLWSKTPFDFITHGGGEYAEWFVDEYPGYPCPAPPADRELCIDFEQDPLVTEYLTPWVRPSSPYITISWVATDPQKLVELDDNIDGLSKALEIVPVIPTHTTGDFGSNHVRIALPTRARKISLTVIAASGVTALAREQDGGTVGPTMGGLPDSMHLAFAGERLIELELLARSAIRIVRICFVVGPSAQDLEDLEAITNHMQEAMAHWSEAGNILQPHAQYRVTCVTTIDAEPAGELAAVPPIHHEQIEYAYFRTDGPPGLGALSIPAGEPNPETFASGLDTLARYVRGTLPDAVPGTGESPNSPVRPVYRAYDIGVFFNEDYVSLMYRAAGRDLGVYLFDQNGQRVHEFDRLLLAATHTWLPATQGQLSVAETLWSEVVEASACLDLDETPPADDSLHGACPGRVLAADATFEVRLIPLLLREEFGDFATGDQATGPGGRLGAWRILDTGSQQGPSLWKIEQTSAGRHVAQLSAIRGGNTFANDPDKPGTVLLRGDDSWSDYQLQLRMESLDADAIGVAFRHLDSGTFYRFSMDRERSYRRLVRVVSGAHTILGEDDFRYETGRTYAVSIEAAGDRLRVRQDGVTIFDVVDATIDRGAIGLYCWGNNGARFHSILVEDVGATAAVPYRFPFTTSRYANFAHQAHSYQDEVSRVSMPDIPLTTFDPQSPIGDHEAREYERLAAALGGDGTTSRELEVHIVSTGAQDRALWLRGPEPLRWNRLALGLQATARTERPPASPEALMFTGFTPGELTANSERIDILCRDTFDPTGYAVEALTWPGPLKSVDAGTPLLFDDFEMSERGVVFEERFGSNALDKYQILDEGAQLGPSTWTVSGQRIMQTSQIFGGKLLAAEPAKPGTVAYLGGDFGNVRVTCSLALDMSGAIGLVFRRSAHDRYYRLSFDPDLGYRRLVKHGAEGVVVLWEDSGRVATGQELRLVLELFDDWLLAHLDGGLLFALRDGELAVGGVGLYAWRCPSAEFTALRVETLEANPIAWVKSFTSLRELRVVDAADAVDDPSAWEIVDAGVLVQHSNVHDDDPALEGTTALLSEQGLADGELGLTMSSAGDGAMGLVFRYQDEHNYYRFSMRRGVPDRRLTRVVNGVPVELWHDTAGYEAARRYQLTLRLAGPGLTGHLDGEPLFSVNDATFAGGQLGLYCWANGGSRFEQLVALRAQRHSGRWTLVDGGDAGAPSTWKGGNGVFRQSSAIFGAAQPDALGTHAIAGDPQWDDYRCSVDLRSDSAGAIGVLFRYTDEDNYYRFSVDASQPYRRLVKRVQRVTTVLWEDDIGTPVGRRMRFVVDAVGDRLTVHLDAERLVALHDSSHGRGHIGLYVSGNPGARFERVAVTAPPASARALFRDGFDGDTLSGFIIADAGDTQGPSAWQPASGVVTQTADIHDLPADRDILPKRGTELVADGHDWTDFCASCRLQSSTDGAIGLSFRYQDADNGYRFSMDSAQSYRRLVKFVNGAPTLLWESADGYVVGRAYKVVVVARGADLRVYLDDVPVCVVSDGELTHGSVALYCWRNEDARFSSVRVMGIDRLFTAWALNETFDEPVAGRWDFTRTTGDPDAVGWQVAPGALQHPGNGTGEDFALLTRGPASNCRIVARLRRTGAGALGVVARFVDPENYFGFWIGEANARLVRRLNAEEAVLSSMDLPAQDREIILTLTCEGTRITGHIDGQQVFDVDESALPAGQAGLVCEGELQATAQEVVLSHPAWRPHFVFPAERPLPAGTPIELRSGSRTGPGTEMAPSTRGAVSRFASEPPDPGEVQLPERAQLRLVSPMGDAEHRRSFLPASAFDDVDVTVIRNRDATRCFLVPTTALTGFAQYRLRMTFRRDNRTLEPDSPVLRQAGDSSDEVATLIIPTQARTR